MSKGKKCPECGKHYVHFDIHWKICDMNTDKTTDDAPSTTNNEPLEEQIVKAIAFSRAEGMTAGEVADQLMTIIEADRKQYAEYVIGEDDPAGFVAAMRRNELRFEQRQRAANYQKGEQE